MPNAAPPAVFERGLEGDGRKAVWAGWRWVWARGIGKVEREALGGEAMEGRATADGVSQGELLFLPSTPSNDFSAGRIKDSNPEGGMEAGVLRPSECKRYMRNQDPADGVMGEAEDDLSAGDSPSVIIRAGDSGASIVVVVVGRDADADEVGNVVDKDGGRLVAFKSVLGVRGGKELVW
ncbi:hypothetical protein M378DRAFT_8159 [Amanita muscaria Koide BX008]|uniref:Uncharacterized protein n=1 Tax=Amanita muscaria (strain Koide BX008) TaxID=946122 RepID=A0A0C2TNC7_AMAMK|nr:hypothetical protein M378DRAFT_8159 [Amanita muscaria Koide BX008]